ncbi:SMEK domain-containing protein [Riemerella anatipestifer]|nr:SMEK domain-containing protein [Riemerella anatipestifer]
MSRFNFSIVTKALSFIVNEVELCNHLNLQNNNIHLENFFRDILNIMYEDRHFINLNSEEKNYTAIDLGDNLKELSFQVTSTTTLAKVRKTIDKYKDEYGYKKLIMLYAKMDKPNRNVNINEEVDEKIKVEEWCIKDLCDMINDLDDEKILEIQRVIYNQINPNLYDSFSKRTDDTASEDWDTLEQKDIRNFANKINDVNPNINK